MGVTRHASRITIIALAERNGEEEEKTHPRRDTRLLHGRHRKVVDLVVVRGGNRDRRYDDGGHRGDERRRQERGPVDRMARRI